MGQVRQGVPYTIRLAWPANLHTTAPRPRSKRRPWPNGVVKGVSYWSWTRHPCVALLYGAGGTGGGVEWILFPPTTKDPLMSQGLWVMVWFHRTCLWSAMYIWHGALRHHKKKIDIAYGNTSALTGRDMREYLDGDAVELLPSATRPASLPCGGTMTGSHGTGGLEMYAAIHMLHKRFLYRWLLAPV